MKRYTEIVKDHYVIDNDLLEHYEEIGYTDCWEKIYIGAAITKLGLLEDWIDGKITLEEVKEKFDKYIDKAKKM